MAQLIFANKKAAGVCDQVIGQDFNRQIITGAGQKTRFLRFKPSLLRLLAFPLQQIVVIFLGCYFVLSHQFALVLHNYKAAPFKRGTLSLTAFPDDARPDHGRLNEPALQQNRVTIADRSA